MALVMAWAVSMVVCGLAQAAPQLALDEFLVRLTPAQTHNAKTISEDLRSHWEWAQVAVGERPNTKAFDPQQVWLWPKERFTRSKEPVRILLHANERYVARMDLVSASQPTSLNLTFKMPRLDTVHLAYRHGDGPWIKAIAGDTVPMREWSFADRQPTFDLPLVQGTVSIVVEMAHRGVIDAPIALQSADRFREERMDASVSAGLLIGVNLVLTAVGIMAALNFRRWSFLSISMMTLLMGLVIATNSGLAGVYVFTDSAEFNDQSKFLINSMWCVLFPWVTATALSQRFHAVWWWRLTVVWAVLGTMGAVWMMQYSLRGLALQSVPVVALSSAGFSLLILAGAFIRGQAHTVTTAPGVLLYALSLMSPLAAYLGYMLNDEATLYASLAMLVAALLFLQTMVRQYRQGRMVVARAKISPGRDVLTGLLSRKGFELALAKNVNRMFAEKVYAAFFYIKVSDANDLQERYGDEGFEVGMVQLAAAISSTVSVVDTVGRVAPNAFGVVVLMPRDAKLASGMAQKFLTRTMALASHGTPMAQTARIAIAWLPVFGTLLPDIERRAVRVLRTMEEGKRITWVGGVYAQADASQLPDGISSPTTKPSEGQHSDGLPSLPGMINRIELEMLGPDTTGLKMVAQRRMRVMKDQHEAGDTLAQARELPPA
jgi:GGDEF domain-containing protein